MYERQLYELGSDAHKLLMAGWNRTDATRKKARTAGADRAWRCFPITVPAEEGRAAVRQSLRRGRL